jgi:hypothetical protein
MRKFIEQQLKETFKSQESFTKEELGRFFRRYEPELNEHTFYSRIRALRTKNIITQLNTNTYTLSTKKEFTPDIDRELGDLGLLTMDFLLEEPYCIWDSDWINQFSRHQAMKNFHIVEASKVELLSLFHFLKDKGWESVFLDPGQETLYLYARENEVPIVLKPLISRSPMEKKEYNSKKLTVPSLEKILVDVYTDVFIFSHIQGAELETVFEKAITRYAVNFTTLFAYARRRNKEEQLEVYLKTHFSHLIHSIVL